LRTIVTAAALAGFVGGYSEPAAASYMVSYSGLAATTNPGVQNGDTQFSGPTILCTPSGTASCAALTQTTGAATASAFTRASIPDGSLVVNLSGNLANGNAAMLINGNVLGLVGDQPGVGMDAILHVTYGWTIANAGSARLSGGGSGGFGPPQTFDTGNVATSRSTTHLDLIADIAAYDGYSFQFSLDLGGTSYFGNEGSVDAFVSFWLELPEGGTLSSANGGVGGVPIEAPAAVPAPGGVPLLLAGIGCLTLARFRNRPRHQTMARESPAVR